MPNIKKPAYTPPTTADLKKGLDRLEEYVKDVQAPDGSVDMGELEDKVGRSRTDHVKAGLDVLKDEFSRSVTVSGGCGGSVTRNQPAAELDAGEVSSVMDALLRAKSRVDDLDTNADGVVGRDETDDARMRGLSGKLARAGASLAVETYVNELGSWRDAILGVREEVEMRSEVNEVVNSAADYHAETDAGKAAILWAYRDVMTNAPATYDAWDTIYDLDDWLDTAEGGFLRNAPAFNHTAGKGHLSDNELGGYFDTGDLSAFASDKQDTVSARVGDWDDWVEGKDLAGIDQVEDPDVDDGAAVSSGC